MANVQKGGAGGICEMTGREFGKFAEETYYWSESIVQNVWTTMQNLFGDLVQGLTQASQPPALSAAARAEPQQKKKRWLR